ncbi:relaxase/mobilization nuclease domain-containing protein [Sphingobium indicum]|uniref:relaxase/mobilization nuclease domain-containing protein n=1 Tax=Sphingobium indicum TaxID=332055 RepID=UPI0035F0B8A1
MREEEGVLPLPSLMEAWRPPAGGKRTLRGAYVRIKPGGSGGGAARPMSMGQAEARAKLERIVRKAPEVMVKVSGKQYGAHHVAEHFGYVARHGKLAVRSSEGEIITEPDRLKAIAQDWAMLDEAMNEHGRERPTSMSLVLSMPGGSTDPETLHDAAQAFARILFEGNHAYMLALHTDTDHPHVHLTVATEGADGTRFNPRKADLHHMRETFAHELRARGVAAEATPRRARGHVQKRVRSAALHLDARLGAEGRRLNLAQLNELRARSFVRAADQERRPEDVMALARQKQIRGAYAEAAVALAATGKPEDRALGQEIAGFLAAMPPAVSRRLARAREILQSERPPQERRNEPEGVSPPTGADEGRPPPHRDRER